MDKKDPEYDLYILALTTVHEHLEDIVSSTTSLRIVISGGEIVVTAALDDQTEIMVSQEMNEGFDPEARLLVALRDVLRTTRTNIARIANYGG